MAEGDDTTYSHILRAMAMLTDSVQGATQTSQQINQSISDLLTKMSQQTSAQATQVLQEETGMGERYQTESVDRSGLIFSNNKRTFDEYQDLSLTQVRTLNNLTTQALQNAIETANMIGKQAVRHSDIAIDHQWNIDEQAYAAAQILNNEVFKEGMRAAVVAAVANAMAQPKT